MKVNRICKASVIATGVLAAALVPAKAAFAQGCALCYSDASATSPQAQAALRHGILILLIPPMMIFSGLFALLYRRRNVHHEASRHTPELCDVPVPSPSEFVLHLN